MQAPSLSIMHPRDGREALHGLVRTLADEAGELAQSADRLQLLFGQLLADPPLRPTDALERAQALDGLVQRLQGLEAFLAALGERRLDDLTADAVQAAKGLTLTSQASRFSAGRSSRDAQMTLGDCDLF